MVTGQALAAGFQLFDLINDIVPQSQRLLVSPERRIMMCKSASILAIISNSILLITMVAQDIMTKSIIVIASQFSGILNVQKGHTPIIFGWLAFSLGLLAIIGAISTSYMRTYTGKSDEGTYNITGCEQTTRINILSNSTPSRENILGSFVSSMNGSKKESRMKPGSRAPE